jgi:hypothetical protein
MTRVGLTAAAVALAAVLLPRFGHATDRFDQRLSPDQQIVHALNRLTFGLRPGNVDEVGRGGLAKWMELQLHPERIAENPVLDQRLKPLVLLCYKRLEQQKGQQGSRPSRARAIRMRSVAMDCGLCRSARARRAAGLELGRNFRGA